MPAPRRAWSDFQIEEIVGNLLRVGVIIAAAVVLVGAGVFLARHATEARGYRIFQGEPAQLTEVPAIVKAAATGSGRAIIQLGLLILIATPVARVVFSLVAFALERDWMYVGVTLIVLAVLVYSLAGGVG